MNERDDEYNSLFYVDHVDMVEKFINIYDTNGVLQASPALYNSQQEGYIVGNMNKGYVTTVYVSFQKKKGNE